MTDLPPRPNIAPSTPIAGSAPPGKPLSRQRSEWVEVDPIAIAGVIERVFRRNVTDGRLTVIVGLEPKGWHLSISFIDHRGRESRYPRWDEIADARYRLAPDDIAMVMVLPPPDHYVAVHDSTFHLHEWRDDGG